MKICVDVQCREVSKVLQEIAFKNGFGWSRNDKKLAHLDAHRLFFTNTKDYMDYPIIEYSSNAYDSPGYTLCSIEETILMLSASVRVLFKGVEFSRTDFEELQRKFQE